MKKLIITAHDLGLSTSINEGIFYSLKHKHNIITTLSLLANAPKSNQAAQIAKKLPISIALNTNFTTFKPLAKNVPSLINKKGNFYPVHTSNWDFSNLAHFLSSDIKKELEAQWHWFVKHVGRKPSAILSRKNEFSDPNLLETFIDKAKQEQLPLRTPVWEWKSNYAAQSYVTQENITHTSAIFVGLLDYRGRFGYNLQTNLDQLIYDIKHTNGVGELLVFPGFIDEELYSLSTLNWQRGQYISLLEHQPEIFIRLKKEFQLISFDQL